MSHIATVKRSGWMIVIRVVGGADCLWMNMYLDTNEWQMTCESDIGTYAYWFGCPKFPTEGFEDFCCQWLKNEKWVLRECVLEKGVPLAFNAEKTKENIREAYAQWKELEYPDDDGQLAELEEVLADVYDTDSEGEWRAVLVSAAEKHGFELPEEWWEFIAEDYTPWQKRFAKICKETIAPELRKFCEQEEKA